MGTWIFLCKSAISTTKQDNQIINIGHKWWNRYSVWLWVCVCWWVVHTCPPIHQHTQSHMLYLFHHSLNQQAAITTKTINALMKSKQLSINYTINSISSNVVTLFLSKCTRESCSMCQTDRKWPGDKLLTGSNEFWKEHNLSPVPLPVTYEWKQV